MFGGNNETLRDLGICKTKQQKKRKNCTEKVLKVKSNRPRGSMYNAVSMRTLPDVLPYIKVYFILRYLPHEILFNLKTRFCFDCSGGITFLSVSGPHIPSDEMVVFVSIKVDPSILGKWYI